MFNFWKKSKKEKEENNSSEVVSGEIIWDDQSTQALNQAAAQAPVPSMMKNMIKKELKQAAEDSARKAGRSNVTPEDLMAGLMSKLPAHMRSKVEDAMKKGPEGLKDLEKELKKGK